ncbi:diguanylate cyclase [Cytobacillus gottheilii]|uniref:diguanylate cyclase n=1 Tax=Cytobacillus gottheilii TaxID=859144 RepID=UPI001593BC6F|nr:diguanylate cyclase [Cytobacillus gottheilii]
MKPVFKKYHYIVLFILFTLFFPVSVSYAEANTVNVSNDFTEKDMTSHLQVYVDSNDLTSDQILDRQDQFVPFSQADIDGDIADLNYWIKIDMQNTSDREKELLLEIKKPHLSLVSFYSDNNGSLDLQETIGYSLPFDNRTIKHRNLVFPLHLDSSENLHTYYLKIETDSFFQAPVTLWTPVAFSAQHSDSQMMFGLFYGIMIAMMIYNSFLYLSLREKTYLYYILFIAGFTTMQAIWDGYAFEWLWGDYPWWALRSNAFFILFTSLFGLLFAKHFLQLKSIAPRLDKWVLIFTAICSVSLIIPFIFPIGVATMASTVIATIFAVFIILIIMKVRLRTREARFFIAAWSLLLIGVLANLLAAYQLLPLNALTLFAPKIGMVVEVLVLSFGLGDKIKRVTIEKEQESKKYYMQTLMQNFFKQMSSIKEPTLLAENGLYTLLYLTKLEKGLYLHKNNAKWEVVVQQGDLSLDDRFHIDDQHLKRIIYATDITPRPFGMVDSFGTFLAIPIVCQNHTGILIVCGDEFDHIDPYQKDKMVLYFHDQFTVLMDNLMNYTSIKESAMYDHLTNVLNRKYFLEKANTIVKDAKEVSILLIDIDHFKSVNDTYGHTMGDKAIIFVANRIADTFKDIGFVGRYGGEEFIVVTSDVNEQEVLHAANALRKSLHSRPLFLNRNQTLSLTVSIGVCIQRENSLSSIKDMILEADDNLYRAKNAGRDKVVINTDMKVRSCKVAEK